MCYPLFFPVDSYKFSHSPLYPPATEKIHCYIEARSNKHYDQMYFWGLDYYLDGLKKWVDNWTVLLEKKEPTFQQILSEHGIMGHHMAALYALARYLKQHKRFPVAIYALEQDKCYPIHKTLVTIENEVADFFWLPTFLETFLLKVWYPVTVATKSYFIKQKLLYFWEKSSVADIKGVDFQFHNFGDRGASSTETAYLAGQAHLRLFKGTDNFMGAFEMFSGQLNGYSIPAMEHSTVITWQKDNEFLAYDHMLECYKEAPVIAMVVDSYDTCKAIDYITGVLKEKIERPDYPVVVLRPDSGDPEAVITQIIAVMTRNEVAYEVNAKGYKVWRKFRIIWGDGVNEQSIDKILQLLLSSGFSAENISFGSGGWLTQHCSRDTLGFVYKASAIFSQGKWFDIFKSPITDLQKLSKKGLQRSVDMQRVY